MYLFVYSSASLPSECSMGAVQFYPNRQMHVGVAPSYREPTGAAVPGDAAGKTLEALDVSPGQGREQPRASRAGGSAGGQSRERGSCGATRTGTGAGGRTEGSGCRRGAPTQISREPLRRESEKKRLLMLSWKPYHFLVITMLSDIPKIKQNRVLASGPLKIQASLCGSTKLNNLVSVLMTGVFEALHSPNSTPQGGM